MYISRINDSFRIYFYDATSYFSGNRISIKSFTYYIQIALIDINIIENYKPNKIIFTRLQFYYFNTRPSFYYFKSFFAFHAKLTFFKNCIFIRYLKHEIRDQYKITFPFLTRSRNIYSYKHILICTSFSVASTL